MEEKMKKDRFTEGVFDSYPDVVSVEEMQQMLRLGKNAVYLLLKDGIIKSIKVGKRYIVPKKYVIDFLLGEQNQ